MKLSIIIPVYNTEQYIEQCIESVLNIKGTENEIIIVNDGSTDRTPEILEKYEKNCSIFYCIIGLIQCVCSISPCTKRHYLSL